MRYMIALLGALVLNATANLLMKVGMKAIAKDGGLMKDGPLAAISTVLSSPQLIVGLTCFILNAALYMYALQSTALKISVAYPVMVGGGFALIAIVAYFHPALSERLSWEQMLGIGLVLAGAMLIATHTQNG